MVKIRYISLEKILLSLEADFPNIELFQIRKKDKAALLSHKNFTATQHNLPSGINWPEYSHLNQQAFLIKKGELSYKYIEEHQTPGRILIIPSHASPIIKAEKDTLFYVVSRNIPYPLNPESTPEKNKPTDNPQPPYKPAPFSEDHSQSS